MSRNEWVTRSQNPLPLFGFVNECRPALSVAHPPWERCRNPIAAATILCLPAQDAQGASVYLSAAMPLHYAGVRSGPWRRCNSHIRDSRRFHRSDGDADAKLDDAIVGNPEE